MEGWFTMPCALEFMVLFPLLCVGPKTSTIDMQRRKYLEWVTMLTQAVRVAKRTSPISSYFYHNLHRVHNRLPPRIADVRLILELIHSSVSFYHDLVASTSRTGKCSLQGLVPLQNLIVEYCVRKLNWKVDSCCFSWLLWILLTFLERTQASEELSLLQLNWKVFSFWFSRLMCLLLTFPEVKAKRTMLRLSLLSSPLAFFSTSFLFLFGNAILYSVLERNSCFLFLLFWPPNSFLGGLISDSRPCQKSEKNPFCSKNTVVRWLPSMARIDVRLLPHMCRFKYKRPKFVYLIAHSFHYF